MDDHVQAAEEELTNTVMTTLASMPNLHLLGATSNPKSWHSSGGLRVPIVSFVVTHPLTGAVLHHNFVTTLLNDLFGVQARGGCMCAGPYAIRLLGISDLSLMQLQPLLDGGEVSSATVSHSMIDPCMHHAGVVHPQSTQT
jgi:selenocysteine lyase/cysteine desulfurase